MLRPEDKVLLDVCCGRWGWSKEFARRGWKCIGIDLVRPLHIPEGCEFICMNLFDLTKEFLVKHKIKFACASTPCTEFALFGMRMFHAKPPYPVMGIKMFNHIREILCDTPHIMENVKAAIEFLGPSINNCGPFHLWGSAVPLLVPYGIKKGIKLKKGRRDEIGRWGSQSWQRKAATAKVSLIPPELAACVADYAERILEIRHARTA